MKKILSYILTTTALLASCASEDFTVSEGTPSSTTTDNTITILADRQDFLCGDNTRAAYSGVSMAFEDGDRIGLYAVNGTTVVSSNVCFTFNGTKWTSTTEVEYNEDYDYYAYYPYVASPYTPAFTQSGLKAKFQLFIDDASNKFHQANQSTKAAFNASDLCIAQAVHVSSQVVRFSFEHKKSLAVFNGRDVGVATFSGDNIPYATGNAKYYIMKDATATTFTDDVDGSYSLYASLGRYVTHPITGAYLAFVARSNNKYRFSKNGLSYSIDDGETWTALAANTFTPVFPGGTTVLWKSNRKLVPDPDEGIGTFSSMGSFEIEGNIKSLFFGDATVNSGSLAGKRYAFMRLFKESQVTDASRLNLSATTLSNMCYDNMFYNCASLTAAPKLPATTLAENCYNGMFKVCTALTAAPELPATTLARSCYQGMFLLCSSLTTPPALPATTLAESCYSNMFVSSGLTRTPELPAETLAEECYIGMFSDCASLTTTSELPATTLAAKCYDGMFYACTSLTTAPELPATTLADYCYESMFAYCSALTTVPTILPATTLAEECYDGMFSGCTSLRTAPELPATTLVTKCYNGMFSGCTNLNYIKAAFTTTPSTSYTRNWVYNVAASGTFYKNAAASWNVTGTDGVPSGWTVITYTP